MADNNDNIMNSNPDWINEGGEASPAEPAQNAAPAASAAPQSQTASGSDVGNNPLQTEPVQYSASPSVTVEMNTEQPSQATPSDAVSPAAPAASTVNPQPDTAASVNQSVNQETTGTAAANKAAAAAEKKPSTEKKKFSLKEWVPGPQVPNQLTILRICMVPLFVILILYVPKPLGNILAMITFIVASLTDTADGYIARRYNYVTTFGKFMDPLADKLLVCSAMICLVDLGRIESWIVIIIIAREFIISGFRLVAADKGVVIAANFWGKLKTIAQMLMVILMVGNLGGFFNVVAEWLKWIALALTLISLATYMMQNRHVLEDNV